MGRIPSISEVLTFHLAVEPCSSTLNSIPNIEFVAKTPFGAKVQYRISRLPKLPTKALVNTIEQ